MSSCKPDECVVLYKASSVLNTVGSALAITHSVLKYTQILWDRNIFSISQMKTDSPPRIMWPAHRYPGVTDRRTDFLHYKIKGSLSGKFGPTKKCWATQRSVTQHFEKCSQFGLPLFSASCCYITSQSSQTREALSSWSLFVLFLLLAASEMFPAGFWRHHLLTTEML